MTSKKYFIQKISEIYRHLQAAFYGTVILTEKKQLNTRKYNQAKHNRDRSYSTVSLFFEKEHVLFFK